MDFKLTINIMGKLYFKDAILKNEGIHFDIDFMCTEKGKDNGYHLTYGDELEVASRFALS